MSTRRAAALARAKAAAARPQSDAGVSVPARLRRCVVEEWTVRPDDDALSRDDLMVRAWGRWRRARWQYAADVGLPVHVACGPSGAPRWHNRG